jgi:hypothetical protein
VEDNKNRVAFLFYAGSLAADIGLLLVAPAPKLLTIPFKQEQAFALWLSKA